MPKQAFILANFGGPRNLAELEPFLASLLTDPLVTGFFRFPRLAKRLFSFIAKKRSLKVSHQYLAIGGKSPIFKDTLLMASQLTSLLNAPVIPFHRYLPNTHKQTLKEIQQHSHCSFIGIPLFPHFTFSVTGSIVQYLSDALPHIPIQWISHFCHHPSFISFFVKHIQDFLKANNIVEHDSILIFSAHGLPLSFVKKRSDPYLQQCQSSFSQFSSYFPKAKTFLSFQSRFGPQKWLQPYTQDLCHSLTSSRKYAVIIPFGFISDHLETLFEIDHEYLPILQKKGFSSFRLPSPMSSPLWTSTLADIVLSSSTTSPQPLLIKH